MKNSPGDDYDGGRTNSQPCILSMDIFGSCNGLLRGDVALDMRIEFAAAPNSKLPVIELGDAFDIELRDERICTIKETLYHRLDHAPQPGLYLRENYMDMERQADANERLIQETPRKLYTREMTLSPSPAKQRLFPESPDIPDYHGGGDSDGSEGDEAVFDMSKGVADLRDCDRLVARSQRAKGMKRAVLRHRPSLPGFGPYDLSPFNQNEDKENRDPTGNARKFRLRGCYRQPLPSRDPTVIHIPSSRPDLTRMRSEEPQGSHFETLGTPASPSPRGSFVIPKRDVTALNLSPQKVHASRIPVKTTYALDEHGGNTAGSPKREIHNEAKAAGAIGPNSPITRTSRIYQAPSTPQTPPGKQAMMLEGGSDFGIRSLGRLKFDSEPTKSYRPIYSSALSTPTKKGRLPASTPRALPEYDAHTLNKTAPGPGLDAERDEILPENAIRDVIPAWSFHDAMSEAKIGFARDLAIDGARPGRLDSDTDDVVDFYSGDAVEGYGDDERFFGEGNLTLPSPSTSSQRSMPWFPADGLTALKQDYQGPGIDTSATVIMPRLEVIDGFLMLVSPQGVVQRELFCEVTVQLYLKDRGTTRHQGYRIHWPQTEAKVPVGFKWQRKYTRGRSVPCIPRFVADHPGEEAKQDATIESRVASHPEDARCPGANDLAVCETAEIQTPARCKIVAISENPAHAVDDTIEEVTEQVMVEHFIRSIGRFLQWVSSLRIKIWGTPVTKQRRRNIKRGHPVKQFLHCLGLMCIVISAYMAGSLHSYSGEHHELSAPVQWIHKDAAALSSVPIDEVQAHASIAKPGEEEDDEEAGEKGSMRSIKGIGVVVGKTHVAPLDDEERVEILSSMIPKPPTGGSGSGKGAGENTGRDDTGSEEKTTDEHDRIGERETITAADQEDSLRDRIDRFLGWRGPPR